MNTKKIRLSYKEPLRSDDFYAYKDYTLYTNPDRLVIQFYSGKAVVVNWNDISYFEAGFYKEVE